MLDLFAITHLTNMEIVMVIHFFELLFLHIKPTVYMNCFHLPKLGVYLPQVIRNI